MACSDLGDNCIQNFLLGGGGGGGVYRRIYSRKFIPPQMKILNMVIPILMHFCSFVSNWSVESRIKPHVTKRDVT